MQLFCSLIIYFFIFRDGQNCPATQNTHASLRRVYGIFFVLFAAIMLAICIAVAEFFLESKQQSPRLDFTLIARLWAWMHKRKRPRTMSGLRKQLQLYDGGLYGAIPMGNLLMYEKQRVASQPQPQSLLSSPSTTSAVYKQQNKSSKLPSDDETEFAAATTAAATAAVTAAAVASSPTQTLAGCAYKRSSISFDHIRKLSRLIPQADVDLVTRRRISNISNESCK